MNPSRYGGKREPIEGWGGTGTWQVAGCPGVPQGRCEKRQAERGRRGAASHHKSPSPALPALPTAAEILIDITWKSRFQPLPAVSALFPARNRPCDWKATRGFLRFRAGTNPTSLKK